MPTDKPTITKLATGDPATQSVDPIADNIARLKALFPELVTEGKEGASVNVDVLKQLVGDATVTDAEEKFGLTWHGKRRARQLALTPSTGTLRPCPEESVDWDTTQNLFIEGDNLEVLKLLQKSYAGQVKLIYIDPPYNTGKDFVYKDNFRDPIGEYQRVTGQVGDEGDKLTSNPESSGRFHTDWLNMLYPRLRLARSLLSDDGAIFISIDEVELPNLREILDDIFGGENSVSTLTLLCNPRGRAQDKHFATTHEYVVCYSRSPLDKGAFEVPKEPEQIAKEYPESDQEGQYRLLELRNTHREFGKHNRPNLYYPIYAASDGSVSVKDEPGRTAVLPHWDDGFEGCWTWGLPKATESINSLHAREVSGKLKIYVKDRADGATRMLKTILTDKAYATDKGQKAFNDLFEAKEKIFQSPKSPSLLADLVATHSKDSDIVLDFFAGSGTTGHAVMRQNAADQSNRRYILVQLPERTGREDYPTIADITKERLRRSAKEIERGHPLWVKQAADLGFRVYKLDSSNIRAWEPDRDDIAGSLEDYADRMRTDRTERDILYELLLKRGLDLCVPIETKDIAGRSVYSIGAGSLFACLAESIDAEAGEALALGIVKWHKDLDPAGDTAIVFRDDAFADDVVKTNVAAILDQNGLKNVRSL